MHFFMIASWVSARNQEGVGGLQEVFGIVGGIGGVSESPGEMAEGIGGKGLELHDQHVRRVWRFRRTVAGKEDQAWTHRRSV